jgi:hypothetical protein
MPAHTAKFTTFTAARDLRAQSGYPNHCPGRLMFYNGTGGELNAVVTDIAGHTVSYPVASLTYLIVEGAFAAIEATTDDTLSAVFAYWWVDGATTLNA